MMNYGVFFSSKVYEVFLISAFGNDDHCYSLATNINVNFSVYTSMKWDSMYVSKFSSICNLYATESNSSICRLVKQATWQKGLNQKETSERKAWFRRKLQRPPSPKTLTWTGTASTRRGFSKHHLIWPSSNLGLISPEDLTETHSFKVQSSTPHQTPWSAWIWDLLLWRNI